MNVRILAQDDDALEHAVLWYENESPQLGLRLIEAFENTVQLLCKEMPPTCTGST